MVEFPLLSVMTFWPFIGIALILFIRGEPEVVAQNSKHVALYTSLFTMAFGLFMMANLTVRQPNFSLSSKVLAEASWY
ncbi:MAG: hypothetical protein R3D66_06605 [Alphaproteobacteria bacterium]